MPIFEDKKIAIIAGGTAGHVFSAMNMHSFYDSTLFVEKKSLRFTSSLKVEIFESFNKFNPIKWIKIIHYFFNILKDFDMVIGFGAYMTIPALIAARILGKEIYVHEQNAILGLANKIAYYTLNAKILSSFKNCTHHCYSGLPMKAPKYQTSEEYILVLTGTNGSENFDKRLYPLLSQWALEHKIHVYAQVQNKNHYLENSFFHTEKWFDNFEEMISKSSLIISRAGALNIAYSRLYNKKSILVPWSKATNNHQYLNCVYSGNSFVEDDKIEEIIPLLNKTIGNISEDNFKIWLKD